MTKENDGKAARKQQGRILLLVGAVCLFFILVSTPSSTKSEKKVQTHIRAVEKSVGTGNSVVAENSAVAENIDKNTSSKSWDTLHQAAFGELHLIDISMGSHKYDSARGTFCKLRWDKHKADPSAVPMFKDLIGQSGGCRDSVTLRLSDVIKVAKSADIASKGNPNAPRSIPPAGFVFHESRCGSTLVANSLAAVNPSNNRVYSESAPLITAMKMVGSDDSPEAKQFIQDIVYLMGRTNDPEETQLFFKIQSIGTTYISSLRRGLPDVPWIFVYRDPVQVMMSHMPRDTNQAVCLRSQRSPPPGLVALIKRTSGRSCGSLSNFESCAAHLSFLCQSIIDEHQSSNSGRMVNYKDLPNTLLDDIFPNYFGIPVTSIQRDRVTNVCTKYSKGRGQKARTWKDDSEHKEQKASDELKAAADEFLYGSYAILESLAKKSE